MVPPSADAAPVLAGRTGKPGGDVARLSAPPITTRTATAPALWNALPGVEKRRKVGDRGALIDQLWSAIETSPDPQSDEFPDSIKFPGFKFPLRGPLRQLGESGPQNTPPADWR